MKRTTRNILLIIAGFIHLTGAFLFLVYYSRTEAVCGVEFLADNSYEVIAETPGDKRLRFKQSANDTLFLNQRPWKSIKISGADENIELLRIDNKSLTKEIATDYDLQYKIEFSKKNKFIATAGFLLRILPVIPVYFVLMSFLLILAAFFKSKCFKKAVFIKICIFRFILKAKKGLLGKKLHALYLKNYQKIVLISGTLLIIPVFYLNLGKYPFAQQPEEKRRALVSLEMKIQDNYIVPTISGEEYYNKPPLFNWLIIPVVDNDNPEAGTRSISVSILLICALVIFILLNKHRGWQHALFVAFLFLTSLHIITYLSFILNLDVLFVLFLIPVFYLNFRFAKQEKYYKLFVVGYLLTSLAFMTKGIPALWFQFVSLMLALLIHKRLRKILSFAHLSGILTFLLITGGYYLLYASYSSPLPYIKQLFDEVMIANKYSFYVIIKHFVSFPAININAFLPAALFFPLFFMRENLYLIIKNKELSYLLLLSFIGISVFSISPYYQPYYSLMVVPLLIDVLLFILPKFSKYGWREALRNYAILLILLIPGIITGYANTHVLYLALVLIPFIFRRQIVNMLLIAGIALVVWKGSGKTWYYSDTENFNMETKAKCKQLIDKYPDVNWGIYSKETKINNLTLFYLTYYTNEIVPVTDKSFKENTLYIMDKKERKHCCIVLDTIPQQYWTADENERFKGKSVYHPLYVAKPQGN
ncbi:MAG: ArnT family glycosyltransferase [Bacteroidales bacterium]